MNNLKDEVAAGIRQWSTELTTAFAQAGFGCQWESHTGSSSVRLGRLTVRENSDVNIKYTIDFERKIIVRGDQRIAVCGLEVYNPVGGLHVHVTKFSPKTVAKIIGYAKQTIETKVEQQKAAVERRRRSEQAYTLSQQAFASFTKPDYASINPNIERAEDFGTYRLLFHEHRKCYPMSRLSAEQAKAIIQSIDQITSGQLTGWQPAAVPVPAHLINHPSEVTDTMKMLLLCVPHQESPVRGWFYGGLLNEFRMEGSPQAVEPTHWMPLPAKPSSV